jgi:dihydrofolate reductase
MKICAGLFMTLDGVVESPEQWQAPYFDDEMAAALGASTAAAEVFLLGRRTYEEFAAFWPHQSSTDNPVADRMNSTPKLVVTTSGGDLSWQNSTALSGDVATELVRLKNEPGGTIQVTGSITLVRWLLRHRLLDELGLLVHPVVVHRGTRLFDDDAEPRTYSLLGDARTFRSGVVALSYQP